MPEAAGIVAGLVGLTLSAAAVTAVVVASSSDPLATVVKVVDGDTIDVKLGRDELRVRLLNVDTPETVDPDEPVQCLGPEATAFLKELLPAGTKVRLEYDDDRTDRYDRVLAGVYLDEELVNASIARAGLGAAVVVGGNDRFYGAVAAAEQEAKSEGVGLHSTEVECTVPAQVDAATSQAQNAISSARTTGAPLGELTAQGETLAAAAVAVAAVETLLDGDNAAWPLLASDVVTLRARIAPYATTLASARQENSAAVAAEQQRIEAERLAAEAAARAAEEARRAEEARLAEEARRAEETRAAEARRAQQRQADAARAAAKATERAPSSSKGSSSGSSGGGGGGGDTYTGCRAYAPGGKTYTKIDCTTKQPIG